MQTSSNKLNQEKSNQLFEQLVTLLCDLRSPQEMSHFLLDLLTETEQTVLAKRLAIMRLLHQGKSYEEISAELHVSSATISNVSENINEQAMAWLEKNERLSSWLNTFM